MRQWMYLLSLRCRIRWKPLSSAVSENICLFPFIPKEPPLWLLDESVRTLLFVIVFCKKGSWEKGWVGVNYGIGWGSHRWWSPTYICLMLRQTIPGGMGWGGSQWLAIIHFIKICWCTEGMNCGINEEEGCCPLLYLSFFLLWYSQSVVRWCVLFRLMLRLRTLRLVVQRSSVNPQKYRVTFCLQQVLDTEPSKGKSSIIICSSLRMPNAWSHCALCIVTVVATDLAMVS